MPALALAALTSFAALACDKSQPTKEENKAAPSSSSATTGAPTESATVRISGSSALQPLVNAAKEKFEATHKGMSVDVSAGGSKKGLADVASGAVQIGDSDIFADAKDQLVDHKVAVVGFAAMANKGPYNEKVAALGLAGHGEGLHGGHEELEGRGGHRAARRRHQPFAQLRHARRLRQHRPRWRQVHGVPDGGQLRGARREA